MLRRYTTYLCTEIGKYYRGRKVVGEIVCNNAHKLIMECGYSEKDIVILKIDNEMTKILILEWKSTTSDKKPN